MSDDPTIIPGLTEWTSLGTLMEEHRLPVGVATKDGIAASVTLRPWCFEDEFVVGAWQNQKGATGGQFLRRLMGWYCSELCGTKMPRGVDEDCSPLQACQEQGVRALPVGKLSFADALTLLFMIRASDEPTLKLPPMKLDGETFTPEVNLADTPCRSLVKGRAPADLEFELHGITWRPPSIRLLDRTMGIGAKTRIAMVEECRVKGPAMNKALTSRAMLLEVVDALELRTCGPKLTVTGTHRGSEWASILDVGAMFR